MNKKIQSDTGNAMESLILESSEETESVDVTTEVRDLQYPIFILFLFLSFALILFNFTLFYSFYFIHFILFISFILFYFISAEPTTEFLIFQHWDQFFLNFSGNYNFLHQFISFLEYSVRGLH